MLSTEIRHRAVQARTLAGKRMEPAKRRKPKHSLRVLENRVDAAIGRQAMLGAEAGEAAVLIEQQFRGSADPKPALAILVKPENYFRSQSGDVLRIEDCKPRAVEPRESTLARQPQIAVASLHDFTDRVERQTIFLGPAIQRILGQTADALRRKRHTRVKAHDHGPTDRAQSHSASPSSSA